MTTQEAIKYGEDRADLFGGKMEEFIKLAVEALKEQKEVKPISYYDCSNAMLKMWMDNVLTDGEYNRIMDKLNAKYMREVES